MENRSVEYSGADVVDAENAFLHISQYYFSPTNQSLESHDKNHMLCLPEWLDDSTWG